MSGANVAYAENGDDVTNGLLIQYKMNEGSGSSVTDTGSENNNGVITAPAVYSADIPYSTNGNTNSLDFSAGGVSRLESNNNMPASLAGANPKSICGWVKHTPGGTQVAFAFGGQTAVGDTYGFFSNGVFWQFWGLGGAADVNTSVAVSSTDWQHLCATYDGSTLQTYVDGVAAASAPRTLITLTAQKLIIGESVTGVFSLNGSVDDVRAYDRVLSPLEVSRIFGNVLFEILEDSASVGGANNANSTAVTAAELATIIGITGVDPANEAAYQAAITAETDFSNLPTVAEVQAIIDAVNTTQTNSTNALLEVLEDSASVGGGNNGNGIAVTAAQLTAIIGITGVDPANEAVYQAAITAEAGFSNPPTVAEVQNIIDAVNTTQTNSTNALLEVLEDSASAGGGNNGNGTGITAAELAAIIGITGVDPANEAAYQVAIAAETGFSNPPTVAEIQAIIDAVNITQANSNNALAEILEDSASAGGGNNGNGTGVTAVELAAIIGITGVDAANEAAYQTAIAAEIGFSNPPTVAEVQAIIDAVNTIQTNSTNTLAEVLEDSASTGGGNNGNGTGVTAVELAAITGITGVDPANEAAYQAAIAAETGFSNPPTVAEVQAIIDAVNITQTNTSSVLAEILEDSASAGGGNNGNGIAVTAAELAVIIGITGVDPANEAAYQAAIAAETGFSNPPTVSEVQAIIDAVNTPQTNSTNALVEVLEDSASAGGGNNGNGTGITAAELAAIIGITGVDLANEAGYQTAIAAETGFSNPPTVAEVQAIIDAVNSGPGSGGAIVTFSGATATGTGTAVASISGGGASCGFDPANTAFVPTSSVSTSAPTSNLFIHGLFNFRLTQCTPGSTVNVTVRWPGAAIPIGTEFWKFGPASAGATDSWFQPVSAVINTATNETTYSVINNGEGDRDSDVNTIVDPFGLAIPDPGVVPVIPPGGSGDLAQPIPTLSEWARIILIMLVGAITLVQHRRQRKGMVDL